MRLPKLPSAFQKNAQPSGFVAALLDAIAGPHLNWFELLFPSCLVAKIPNHYNIGTKNLQKRRGSSGYGTTGFQAHFYLGLGPSPDGREMQPSG